MRLAALRGDPKAQEWLDIVIQASRDRHTPSHGHDRDRDREERERKYSDDERDRGRRLQKGQSIQQRAEQHRGRDFQERERKYCETSAIAAATRRRDRASSIVILSVDLAWCRTKGCNNS